MDMDKICRSLETYFTTLFGVQERWNRLNSQIVQDVTSLLNSQLELRTLRSSVEVDGLVADFPDLRDRLDEKFVKNHFQKLTSIVGELNKFQDLDNKVSTVVRQLHELAERNESLSVSSVPLFFSWRFCDYLAAAYEMRKMFVEELELKKTIVNRLVESVHSEEEPPGSRMALLSCLQLEPLMDSGRMSELRSEVSFEFGTPRS